MRIRAFRVTGKREIVRFAQFCNGPLQNWTLNTLREELPQQEMNSDNSTHALRTERPIIREEIDLTGGQQQRRFRHKRLASVKICGKG